VTGEKDGQIEIRNSTGVVSTFAKEDVVKSGMRKESMMPEGLAANLNVHQMASLLDFLHSQL